MSVATDERAVLNGIGGSTPLLFKREQVRYWHSEALGYSLDGLEGRRIDAAFDETQEVDRDAECLRESLLRHPAPRANFAQSCPKHFPQSSHLDELSKRESPVVWFRAPPNEITGR